MTAMDALFAVQDEDVIRGQLDYRRAHLSERQDVVAAEVERDETATAIAGLELERLEHSRRQNRLEGEVVAIEVRLAELDKKLYGSAITSAREATSLQDEIGHLRRRQDDLEGSVLELMEVLEPMEQELARLADQATAGDVAIHAAQTSLADAEAAVDGELYESASRRELALPQVPADVLTRYEGSRASFGSSTVVRFSGSDCSGCPYSMPAVEADRVRSLTAGTLADCSECGRLVVR